MSPRPEEHAGGEPRQWVGNRVGDRQIGEPKRLPREAIRIRGSRGRHERRDSRVRRGAAWNDEAQWCRSAMRLRYEPERNADHIGFRVVLVAL